MPDPASPDRARLSSRLRDFAQRCSGYWGETIWKAESLDTPGPTGTWMRLARIAVITRDGLTANQLFARAAALSYSSLLALGPVLAMLVLFSGTFFRGDAETQIKSALYFVAPTLQEYQSLADSEAPDAEGSKTNETAETTEGSETATAGASALDELIAQIVRGAEGIVGQINTGGSQAFGLLGFFVLAFVAIQMLTAVERTLNQIWGARSGRSWGQRIVAYWTFVSLGAVLGLGAVAVLSTAAAANLFETMPYGETLNEFFVSVLPLLGFAMLVVLLTAFYLYFPNAAVRWRPALCGAALVAALLMLNNYLSVLYVGQVLRLQSLYGSAGIIPVLMLGLYFFWVFVLLGGQLGYAIQNVNNLSRREAWSQVAPGAQERLTLAAFLLVARAFAEQRPAPSASELGARMRVPGNVLNESLSRLVEIGWITPTLAADPVSGDERRYHPAKPLDAVTLADFRTAFAESGDSDASRYLEPLDPVLPRYRENFDGALREGLGALSVRELLAETAEEEETADAAGSGSPDPAPAAEA